MVECTESLCINYWGKTTSIKHSIFWWWNCHFVTWSDLYALLDYLKSNQRSESLIICRFLLHTRLLMFRSSSTSPLAMPLILSTRAAHFRPGCSGLWLATPSHSSSCLPISTTRPTAASHASSRPNLQLTASPMAPIRHQWSWKMARNKRKEKESMTEKKHGRKCNTGSHGFQNYPWNLNRHGLFGNCENKFGLFC